MATEWTLPNMGEGFQSGVLVNVLVNVGDAVEEEQPVLELETDKAVQEIPSTVSGTVTEIHVKAGQKLAVGDKIFSLDAGANGAAANGTAASNGALANGSAPAEASTQEGSQKAEQLTGMGAEQQGTTSISSQPAGTASAEGREGMTSHTAPAQTGTGNAVQSAPPRGASVAAAPSVRRLARELGVDIAQVSGTGPGGRISFSDVRSFFQRTQSAPVAGGIPAIQLPDFSKWGEIERQPMSGIRRATAEQMARAWATVPHVTQTDKADVTQLENLRKQFAAQAEKAGGKLTVTAIALKVVATALKKFPQFNASIDMATQEVIYKNYVHIGVAVDTDRGLLVPVIRDVDKKSIVQLSVELTQLGEKARAKKTTVDEMQGGTFTITNLGGIGGSFFTPIVNTPEVAILGMSRSVMEPVWNGKDFEPRLMMPLSLSYDHRLIDGANGARFLRWISQALEQPFLLSLEG